jgi:putative membrane protein
MLWIKTFHLLFVIVWMTGLFYFPRILVHYVEGDKAGEDVHRLVFMAQSLFGFMSLMAVTAILLGAWLWLDYGVVGNWLAAKLMLVLLLVLYHGQCFSYLMEMRQGSIKNTGLFFRIFNESTLLIVIPILILVFSKPF